MGQMYRHSFLHLCFRKFSLYPFHDPFAKCSKRLIGSDVRPSCSALKALCLLEMDRTIPNLGRRERAGHLFFQALMEIRVNLPLAGQELMKRVATSPRSPMYPAPQFGNIRQIIGPEIVNDGQGQLAPSLFDRILTAASTQSQYCSSGSIERSLQ